MFRAGSMRVRVFQVVVTSICSQVVATSIVS
jgi:hypothetical protein